MLPAETLADVVGFLGYYDLGGVKLANKTLSSVANQCADAIRLFDFSDFSFYIIHLGPNVPFEDYIQVYRLDSDGYDWPLVCQLGFTSEESLSEFISEAFRNCTLGRLVLRRRLEHILPAISSASHTINVVDNLYVVLDCFENGQELLEFVASFPRVKV
ncbi:hypothetical protein AAVH_35679 [Aphelenchoides avenae]|nr:hypothetical protein AAVH_35679 [Aphelenchus avenae]